MNWLQELITQPSFLQVVILLSVISAIGLSLGKMKIKKIQLGITFVFFAGIFLGDVLDRTGINTDWGMVSLAQNFGLILFVYTLGVQVGPGFFSSMKKGGLKLNLFGILVIVLTTIGAFVIYGLSDMSFPETMGVLSGSVTNTPMLGAAQQSLLDVYPTETQAANNMASACAVAYPFGVMGVIISLMILNRVFGKNTDKLQDTTSNVYAAEFHISNPAVFGKSIKDISGVNGKNIILTRLWRDGVVIIPSADTKLAKNDHIMCVLDKQDVELFQLTFGEQDPTDWNRPDIDWDHIDNSGLISSHVLVTKPELNGVKIGSLHLRNSFDINITRVNRAGIQLVAYPGLRLQLGDRLTVVGSAEAVSKVGEILGNEEKVLHNPNLVALFIGLTLGVILGSIPFFIPGMSVPVKLGVAGGPIIVGILMGAFGPNIHLNTYFTRSANLMLRQMGIVIYLACLGLTAGSGFIETVFCSKGLLWIFASLLIAIVPIFLSGIIAKKVGHLDYAQTSGMLCAAMANPIALTYANANTDEQEASESYATVYPLAIFLRVISAQILMLLCL